MIRAFGSHIQSIGSTSVKGEVRFFVNIVIETHFSSIILSFKSYLTYLSFFLISFFFFFYEK